MAIAISQSDYWELLEGVEPTVKPTVEPTEATVQTDHRFETIWTYPKRLGQGYRHEIQLREGLELAIVHYQLHDAMAMQLPEREHPLEYDFYLAGGFTSPSGCTSTGQYSLCGSGLAPVEIAEWSAHEQMGINVHIEPELFVAWLNQSVDTLTPELQHLIKPMLQTYYVGSGDITTTMQMALQQILHCPFHGLTKQLYLESKVWELMALLIEQELNRQGSKSTQGIPALKPEDVDRIHQARAILSQRFDHPPSLMELARLVGLNDCTLKRGFRQVFGTTAFGYLHDYRLEQARQLLEEQQLNVSEIAQAIGFANRSYFAAAFRKKFGVSPKEYLSRHRNSA
jgi:AraC-like DNA-binding protein